jgi:hypothetical protein
MLLAERRGLRHMPHVLFDVDQANSRRNGCLLSKSSIVRGSSKPGEELVTGRGRFVHAAVACAGAMLLFIDSGQATDLNGVWASDPAVCNKVFVTKAGKISFRRDADLHGSGFIIDGQRIRGRVATCKLLRTKVEVPVVHMIASCATDVMLSNVQLTVRVLEPDKINRVFPGLEDMEMPFYRCPIGKGKP